MTSSTEIIASIQARSLFPRSQQTFTDADILRFANEEIASEVVPLILKYNEEYFVREYQIGLQAGKSRYRIPPRAVGGRVRDVYWLDQNGNPVSLPKVGREQIEAYGLQSNRPTGYFIEGMDVRLLPTQLQQPQGRLVIVIAVKPNQLVPVNRCRKILQVTRDRVTLASIPGHITTGTRIDIIGQHAGGELKEFDRLVVGISGNVLLLEGGAIETAEAGDWVALAGESPTEQFMPDLHTYLLELVSLRILQAMNNVQGVQTKQAAIQRLQQTIPALIDNRVTGGSQKIINRNSLLRRGR